MIEKQKYKEKTIHGTSDFPLAWYSDISDTWQNFFFVPHWHEELEILYVLDGRLELIIDGVSYIIGPNSVALIPPNLLHIAYRINNERCRFCSIVFSIDLIASKTADKIQREQLQPFLENPFLENYILLPGSQQQSEVQKLIHTFEKTFIEESFCRELLIKGVIIQLLAQLIQTKNLKIQKTNAKKLQEERERTIIEFISSNFDEKLTLSSLANSVMLSKEQFTRFFKKSFRTSPIHYLNQFRLQKATELLQQTDLQIIEIAQLVGFDSSNYFSSSFRKCFGISPSEFRKMT